MVVNMSIVARIKFTCNLKDLSSAIGYYSYTNVGKNAFKQRFLKNQCLASKDIKMGYLAINNKILEKYFRFLAKFDNNSKKRLIIKLTESIETGEDPNKSEFNKLFGAWIDKKSAEEIIKRNQRLQ